MATGTILWSAPIQGLVLPPIEINGGQPAVSKIKLRTESESRLTITCTLEDVFHQSDAILMSRDAVDLLANRLAFEFSCHIGEPTCDGCSLPTDGTAKRHEVVQDSIALNDIAEGPIRPGQDRIKALIPTLEQPAGPRDMNLRFYCFSAGQRDSVTSFMFLYNLLLQLTGDTQKAVDICILTIDPQVPVTQHPHKLGVSETLFTRLRNEVCHFRANTDQVTTAKEVKENVAWFKEIVRKAVLSKL